MAEQYLGIDVAERNTTQQHPLGLEVIDPADPTKHYMYVIADDTVAVNSAVFIDTGVGGSGVTAQLPWVISPTTDLAEAIFGIADTAFAAGEYGFVLIQGEVTVLAASSLAVDEICVSTATDGTVDGFIAVTTVDPTKAQLDALHASVRGRTVICTVAESGGTASVYIY